MKTLQIISTTLVLCLCGCAFTNEPDPGVSPSFADASSEGSMGDALAMGPAAMGDDGLGTMDTFGAPDSPIDLSGEGMVGSDPVAAADPLASDQGDPGPDDGAEEMAIPEPTADNGDETQVVDDMDESSNEMEEMPTPGENETDNEVIDTMEENRTDMEEMPTPEPPGENETDDEVIDTMEEDSTGMEEMPTTEPPGENETENEVVDTMEEVGNDTDGTGPPGDQDDAEVATSPMAGDAGAGGFDPGSTAGGSAHHGGANVEAHSAAGAMPTEGGAAADGGAEQGGAEAGGRETATTGGDDAQAPVGGASR